MIKNNYFFKRYLPVCFFTLAMPVFSYSQSSTSTGAQFLEVPGGVRGAGMGGMFTAVADDISTTYWNTAGLALLKNIEVNASEVSYFANLNFNFVGLALPLSPGSVIGLNGAFDFVPSFNSTNNPLATPGSENDFTIDLGFGQTFGQNLALGIGARFISTTLLSYSATGGAVNAGMLLYTNDRNLTLGLSVQNLGQISSFTQYSTVESLPLDLRAGLAYRIQPQKPTNFLLGVDVEQSGSDNPMIHTGGEAWVGISNVSLALRAGYSFNPSNQDLGGEAGASLGAGIRFTGFELNYALVPEGVLGDNQWFSLTYRFGTEAKPTPVPTPEPMKIEAVEIKPQIVDYQTGTLKQATFDLKMQARTDIKNWTLDIKDPDGNVLRTYVGKGLPPRQIAWDGKDSNGNVVSGGIFANYNFRTVDTRGQQEVVSSDPIYKMSQVTAREANLLASISVKPQVFAEQSVPVTVQQRGEPGVPKVLSVPFDSGSYELKLGYLNYLDQVAELIRKYPNSRVYIEGHAYHEGTALEAMLLSQNRADAVMSYLVEKGKVSPDNLYSRGHGDSSPLDTSGTEKADIKNRRVDIVILIK
jgi:outer membrane protein OmpA-like peptidoglycan-associated protein